MPAFSLRYLDGEGNWHRRPLPDCRTKAAAKKEAEQFFNAHDFPTVRLHRRLRYDADEGQLIGAWVALIPL